MSGLRAPRTVGAADGATECPAESPTAASAWEAATRATAGALASLVLAAGLVLGLPAPASAQDSGVFDQPFQPNPFQALLSDRPTLAFSLRAGATNNTLGMGDLWAINELRDDFRFTDVFLIAGLVPEGEGVALDVQNRARIDLAVLPLPFGGRLGLSAGGHMFAEGLIPDDVASVLRDGTSGDRVDVDFSRLGGSALAYGDIGVLGLFDLPAGLLPPGVRLRVGGGLHFLYGAGYYRFAFDGDGDGLSRVSISHDGIDAQINPSMPIGGVEPGGSGRAIDLVAALNLGESIYLGALLTNIGSITVRQVEREVGRLSVRDASYQEFFEALDAMETDTLPGGDEREVTLPRSVRFEGSYRLSDAVRLGAAVDAPFGDDFTMPSSVQARAELRPVSFLPLRVGATLGGSARARNTQAGFGLHLGALRLDFEAIRYGGLSLADSRGVTFMTGVGLRF